VYDNIMRGSNCSNRAMREREASPRCFCLLLGDPCDRLPNARHEKLEGMEDTPRLDRDRRKTESPSHKHCVRSNDGGIRGIDKTENFLNEEIVRQ
jgi:hypothetical protein